MILWPLFQTFQHPVFIITLKPVLSGHSKEDPKYAFKTENYLMQVKSIADSSCGAFCKKIDLH